jgi:hypothetical protein
MKTPNLTASNIDTARAAYAAAAANEAATKAEWDAKRLHGFDHREDAVRVRALEAEAKHLRAENALSEAAHNFDVALHISEVASGDADAVASDLATVIADVEAELAEHARLLLEADAAMKRAAGRIETARGALAARAQKRAASGLPPPRPFRDGPTPPGWGGPDRRPPAFLAVAKEALTGKVPHDLRIAGRETRAVQIDREAHRIRLVLEQKRIEAEEREKEKEDWERQDAERRRAKAEQGARNHAELVAQNNAKRERENALVEANRQRDRA